MPKKPSTSGLVLAGKPPIKDIYVPHYLDAKVVPSAAMPSPGDVVAHLRMAQEGDPRRYLAFLDELLARDAHLYAEIGKACDYLTNSTTSAEPSVRAVNPERSKTIATVANAELLRPGMIEDVVESLAMGIFKQLAGLEVIVEPGTGIEGRERLVEINVVPPARFTQKPNDTTWFLQRTQLVSDLVPVQDLGPSLVFFECEAAVPNLSRRGVIRRCLQATMLRVFGIAWWARFIELFGIPFRKGHYRAGDMDGKANLVESMTTAGANGYVALPDGTDFEFVAGMQGLSPHQDQLEWAAREISKAIHGSTQTTDISPGAGSQATAVIHDEVALRRTRSRARRIGVVLTSQLLRPWVARNFSPDDADQNCPTVVIQVEGARDVVALTTAFQTAQAIGLPLGKTHVYQALGWPEPNEDEEILEAPQAPAPVAEPGAGPIGIAGKGLSPAVKQKMAGMTPAEKKKMMAEMESYIELSSAPDDIDDIEEWALSILLPAASKSIDPLRTVIDQGLKQGQPYEQIDQALTRAFLTNKSGLSSFDDALSAVMLQATLAGKASV